MPNGKDNNDKNNSRDKESFDKEQQERFDKEQQESFDKEQQERFDKEQEKFDKNQEKFDKEQQEHFDKNQEKFDDRKKPVVVSSREVKETVIPPSTSTTRDPEGAVCCYIGSETYGTFTVTNVVCNAYLLYDPDFDYSTSTIIDPLLHCQLPPAPPDSDEFDGLGGVLVISNGTCDEETTVCPLALNVDASDTVGCATQPSNSTPTSGDICNYDENAVPQLQPPEGTPGACLRWDSCGVCGGTKNLSVETLGQCKNDGTEVGMYCNCELDVCDCNNDCGGLATVWSETASGLEDCGFCWGGNSGNVSCNADCNGVDNGTGTLDDCGICDGPGKGAGECDCHSVRGTDTTGDGQPNDFTPHYLDKCGICGGTGGSTTGPWCGACDPGVCLDVDGNEIECICYALDGFDEDDIAIPGAQIACSCETCCDCAGVPNGNSVIGCNGICGSGLVNDGCGECGGFAPIGGCDCGNGSNMFSCDCCGCELEEYTQGEHVLKWCDFLDGPGCGDFGLDLDDCGCCGGPGVIEGACDCRPQGDCESDNWPVKDICGVCDGPGLGSLIESPGICREDGMDWNQVCDCTGKRCDMCGVCGGNNVCTKPFCHGNIVCSDYSAHDCPSICNVGTGWTVNTNANAFINRDRVRQDPEQRTVPAEYDYTCGGGNAPYPSYFDQYGVGSDMQLWTSFVDMDDVMKAVEAWGELPVTDDPDAWETSLDDYLDNTANSSAGYFLSTIRFPLSTWGGTTTTGWRGNAGVDKWCQQASEWTDLSQIPGWNGSCYKNELAAGDGDVSNLYIAPINSTSTGCHGGAGIGDQGCGIDPTDDPFNFDLSRLPCNGFVTALSLDGSNGPERIGCADPTYRNSGVYKPVCPYYGVFSTAMGDGETVETTNCIHVHDPACCLGETPAHDQCYIVPDCVGDSFACADIQSDVECENETYGGYCHWHDPLGITSMKVGDAFCGGSLVGPTQNWVLTAAHCCELYYGYFYGHADYPMSVVIGVHDGSFANAGEGSLEYAGGFTPNQESLPIDHMYIHPDYNEMGNWSNDICLLHLAGAGAPRRFKPIEINTDKSLECMDTGELEYNPQCSEDMPDIISIGLGMTTPGPVSPSEYAWSSYLKETTNPIRPNCGDWETYTTDPYTGQISSYYLCVGGCWFTGMDPENQFYDGNTCNGDSGGPNIAYIGGGDPILMGVTSWGPSNCSCLDSSDDKPQVMASVAGTSDWILQYISTPEAKPVPIPEDYCEDCHLRYLALQYFDFQLDPEIYQMVCEHMTECEWVSKSCFDCATISDEDLCIDSQDRYGCDWIQDSQTMEYGCQCLFPDNAMAEVCCVPGVVYEEDCICPPKAGGGSGCCTPTDSVPDTLSILGINVGNQNVQSMGGDNTINEYLINLEYGTGWTYYDQMTVDEYYRVVDEQPGDDERIIGGQEVDPACGLNSPDEPSSCKYPFYVLLQTGEG